MYGRDLSKPVGVFDYVETLGSDETAEKETKGETHTDQLSIDQSVDCLHS